MYTPKPEINISPVPNTMSGSRHFVPVTRNLCRSSVYDILLTFENLPVIATGRKRILSVTHEIVPDSDRWPAVISCTKHMIFHPYCLLFGSTTWGSVSSNVLFVYKHTSLGTGFGYTDFLYKWLYEDFSLSRRILIMLVNIYEKKHMSHWNICSK